MLKDFNPPKRYVRRRSWLLPSLIVCVCLSCVVIFYVMQRQPENRTNPTLKNEEVVQSEKQIKTVRGLIKSGDSISSLLGGMLSPQEILELSQKCRAIFPLDAISAGQPYKVSLQGGSFLKFKYDIDNNEQLIVCRDQDDFSISKEPIRYEVERVVVKGEITSSLFQAVVDIGESEGLALKLADIFAWDIDFFNDIQIGDSFEVVIEKRYRKGQPPINGRLLAARFKNQGELSQAFYFEDGKRSPDYYDQNGQSLRKAFLKAPLSFSRISSGFNMQRRHPVTKRIKAHPAIDYAAPTGTPILSIGDGTVSFAGQKRYNGKYVKIRHPNGWVTMYNHMSRFGKDILAGKKVRQGQLIGYVGSTGLSTGPHLDFRMYRNGKPVNPLKVQSPPARPVSSANLMQFKAMVSDLVAIIESKPDQDKA